MWKLLKGHKNWCKFECGEEGVDWEIHDYGSEKGLGLRAKRFFPSKSRIMVDPIRPLTRNVTSKAIHSLMPANATTIEKFRLNALGGGDEDQSMLCLRIARANHACDANASHYLDDTKLVKVLFAERDIKEGEEICINYSAFLDLSKSMSSAVSRQVLQQKWNIRCPADCWCYRSDIACLVEEGRRLDSAVDDRPIDSPSSALLGIKRAERLLCIHEDIHSSWITKLRTLYDGFQVAVLQRKTLPQAKEFIEKACEIQSTIFTPKSVDAMKYETWVKHPEQHRNYLLYKNKR